ncbi:MAG: macro domain-containing protein [Desulfitobacterium sp.]
MNGVKSFLRLCFSTFFSILGGCWLIIEIVNTIFPNKVPIVGNPHFLLVPSLILSIIYIVPVTFCITYRVDGHDKIIKIRIGNILHKKNGTLVVGTNDSLSTDLDLVGSGSLQAQVTKLIGQEAIENQFSEAKRNFNVSQDGRYSFGLCFEGRAVRDKKVRFCKKPYSFLYIIMSSLTAGQNANTTKEQLTRAIKQMFVQTSKLNIKDATIYCPLLGTGTANVDLPKQTVAEILISQYIAHCRENGCNIKSFIICIHWKDLQHIKLNDLRRTCEQMVVTCSNCPRER